MWCVFFAPFDSSNDLIILTVRNGGGETFPTNSILPLRNNSGFRDICFVTSFTDASIYLDLRRNVFVGLGPPWSLQFLLSVISPYDLMLGQNGFLHEDRTYRWWSWPQLLLMLRNSWILLALHRYIPWRSETCGHDRWAHSGRLLWVMVVVLALGTLQILDEGNCEGDAMLICLL